MSKTLYLSLSLFLALFPMQSIASPETAMVPIISFLISDSETVHINEAPIADAGADIQILEGLSATVDGSNSSDDTAIISYQWKEDGVVLSNEMHFSKSFAAGIHYLTLRVEDAEGESAVSHIRVAMLSQALLDDEGSSKNTYRLSQKSLIQSNLILRMDAQRAAAPQDYLNQQNVQETEVVLNRVVPLTIPMVESIQVSATKSGELVLQHQETFTFHDLGLISRNNRIYLSNKTERLFSELMAQYTDTNGKTVFKKLVFDTTIEAFREYELSSFEHASQMTLVKVAPLFDPKMAFKANIYDTGKYRASTPAEEDNYKIMLSQSKISNNSVHAFDLFYETTDTEFYLGSDFTWAWQVPDSYSSEMAAYGNEKEYCHREMVHYLTPKAERFEFQTYLGNDAAGRADLGAYRGKRMVSVIAGYLQSQNLSYRISYPAHTTYIHEMMHGYGYTHQSALTHIFSDILSSLNYYFYGKNKVVETLPEYVFDTQKIAGNEYKLTVYATGESNETYFNVDLYSRGQLSATITKTAQNNEFILKTAAGYSPEYIVRVSSFDSDQVMSKIILP